MNTLEKSFIIDQIITITGLKGMSLIINDILNHHFDRKLIECQEMFFS